MLTQDGTFFEVHGREGAPVVVLVHGLGLCREIWTPCINTFAQKYRVISYDLYGHGKSEPSKKAASLTVYSKQIASLLNELNIPKAAIVGFSIGGMINRRFAIDHPNRLTCQVILNSPHDRGEVAQELVEGRAKTVREQGALATMEPALARWFTPVFRKSAPDQVQQVVDWRQLVDAESYAQAAWVLASGVRELIRPKPAISVPTLVMTCENDTGSTPAMSSEIAADIDGAELIIIPRLQHLGLMEEPESFVNPIMDYLGQMDSSL